MRSNEIRGPVSETYSRIMRTRETLSSRHLGGQIGLVYDGKAVIGQPVFELAAGYTHEFAGLDGRNSPALIQDDSNSVAKFLLVPHHIRRQVERGWKVDDEFIGHGQLQVRVRRQLVYRQSSTAWGRQAEWKWAWPKVRAIHLRVLSEVGVKRLNEDGLARTIELRSEFL